MAETSPIAMLRSVIDRGMQAWRLATPAAAPGNPAIAGDARAAFKTVDTVWSIVDQVLANAAGRVATVMNDPRFTPQAKATQKAELIAAARDQADTGMQQIAATLSKLMATLRAAALPKRPTPADAAQEAAIANLKADLRMLLDGTGTSAVSQELLDLIANYQASGNALAVWFLVASDWPSLYLRSRGIDEVDFTARLPQVMAGLAGDSDTMSLALELLRIIEGPQGMLGATVAMQTAANMALDELTTPGPAPSFQGSASA